MAVHRLAKELLFWYTAVVVTISRVLIGGLAVVMEL